jgi:hypothetical protein
VTPWSSATMTVRLKGVDAAELGSHPAWAAAGLRWFG